MSDVILSAFESMAEGLNTDEMVFSYEEVDILLDEKDLLITAYEDYCESLTLVGYFTSSMEEYEDITLEGIEGQKPKSSINFIKLVKKVGEVFNHLYKVINTFILSLVKHIRMAKSSTHTQFYELSKEFSKQIEGNSDLALKTEAPIQSPFVVMDKLTILVEGIDKINKMFNKEIETIDSKLKVGGYNISTLKDSVNVFLKNNYILKDIASGGNLPSAKNFVYQIIYEKHVKMITKSNNVNASQYFSSKDINYDILSSQSMEKMKKLEGAAKVLKKALHENLKESQDMVKYISQKKETEPDKIKSLVELYAFIISTYQYINTFITGIILETFNEFLYMRSLAFKYGYKYIEEKAQFGDEDCMNLLSKFKSSQK